MIENEKDNQLGIKTVTYMLDEEFSQEAKDMFVKLSNREKIIDCRNLDFSRNNNLELYFSDYRSLKELLKAIYYRNLSIDEAERIQEYEAELVALERYRPRNSDYKTKREHLLNNAKKFYDGREMIINAFKDKIFPFNPEEGLSKSISRDEDEDEDFTLQKK